VEIGGGRRMDNCELAFIEGNSADEVSDNGGYILVSYLRCGTHNRESKSNNDTVVAPGVWFSAVPHLLPSYDV